MEVGRSDLQLVQRCHAAGIILSLRIRLAGRIVTRCSRVQASLFGVVQAKLVFAGVLAKPIEGCATPHGRMALSL